MDYQKFIQQFPQYYERWGTDRTQPHLQKFQAVLDLFRSLTSMELMLPLHIFLSD
jgi:hypothetical protein